MENSEGVEAVKKGMNMSRKHVICEKWPIVAMVLTTLVAMILTTIPALLGLEGFVESLLSSAIAVGILILFQRWFSPEFKGTFALRVTLAEVGLVFIPYIVKSVVNVGASWLDTGFYFKPTLTAVGMGIAAGFCEETWFRGLAVPIGMGYLPREKRIFTTVLVTSIIFGVIHAGNVFNGARLDVGIIQAIATTFAAFFFVAVFLRTGNILIPIFMHGFWDWVCFVTDPTLVDGVMMNDGISFALIAALVLEIALGCAGLYLIRPAMHGKIDRVWDQIWVRPMEASQQGQPRGKHRRG